MFVTHTLYGITTAVPSITITEITESRVRGTRVWDNEMGVSSFDVKRQPNDSFFLGGSSGKIRYSFNKC